VGLDADPRAHVGARKAGAFDDVREVFDHCAQGGEFGFDRGGHDAFRSFIRWCLSGN